MNLVVFAKIMILKSKTTSNHTCFYLKTVLSKMVRFRKTARNTRKGSHAAKTSIEMLVNYIMDIIIFNLQLTQKKHEILNMFISNLGWINNLKSSLQLYTPLYFHIIIKINTNITSRVVSVFYKVISNSNLFYKKEWRKNDNNSLFFFGKKRLNL